MIPTLRTFTALLAASAVARPRPSFAQTASRIGTIKTGDGTELFVKDTGGTGRAIVLTHAWPMPVSFEQAKATAAGIAGSKLIAYADASHCIVVTERDRVTSDLQNFLAS